MSRLPKKDAAKPKPEPASVRAEQASNELLDYLFGSNPDGNEDSGVAPEPEEGIPPIRTEWIDVELLDDNPYQPRTFITPASVEDLKKSINESGQIQAATARPHPTRAGRFQLGVGHRRKASVKAGANAGIKQPQPERFIGRLRVEVSPKDDEQMLDEAFAENDEREPLSIFDRASYYIMLRELETRRLRGIGLTPVSSETARRRAGATVTSDGLMSWEELVIIRKNEGKPLPGARTLRRIVAVLDLAPELRGRLTAINFADPGAQFVGVTEKHCSAILLLSDPGEQAALIGEIEKEHLSANETFERARNRRDQNSGESSRETEPRDNQGASEEVSASPSGEDATPSSTTTGSKSKRKTKAPGGKGQDLIEAFLQPATQGIADAARLWPELRVGGDYRDRVIEELDRLDQRSAELRHALDAPRKKSQRE